MPEDVGLVLGSAIGPEHLRFYSRRAEEAGFDELWLAEDFFFTGGISAAAICLAETERIRVGLGVVSAVVRHPALLAMELSTLAGAFPGRLVAGIGLGVPAWIEQMGLNPDSALRAVSECVTSVAALLRGEEVSQEGGIFTFREVKLTYPIEEEALQVHLGAIGPRMLELSGRIADGSVLSVIGGTDYLRWAAGRIELGRQQARRSDDHRLTAFALYSVDTDALKAREAMRAPLAFYLGAGGPNALTDQAGISAKLTGLLEGDEPLEDSMPDEWIDLLTVAGDPDHVVNRIQEMFDAGADSVGLFPIPVARLGSIIDLTSSLVLPAIRGR